MKRLRTLSVVLSASLVILVLRPALSEHFERRQPVDEKNILVSSKITAEHARYHYLLGLFSQNGPGKESLPRAVEEYRSSLGKNPTDGSVWLALARVYRELGDMPAAGFAFGRAVATDKNTPNSIWEAGVFSLLSGRTSYATRLFRRYIVMVPGEQENVFSLFLSMKVDPSYMLENLIPPGDAFYRRYLKFLMANRLLSESAGAWERLRALRAEKGDYLGYVDFLIDAGENGTALRVWEEYTKAFGIAKSDAPRDKVIWNGDFELDIENGGFDWRIGKAEGVRVFRDLDMRKTGDASLSANFDGAHNPDVRIVSQVVPVEAGKRYVLMGYMRTENITTTNGVFLEITGHKCGSSLKRSEPLTGTHHWSRIDIEFVPPADCRAVAVAVRREKSEKFDNKIGGDVWIDSFAMAPAQNR